MSLISGRKPISSIPLIFVCLMFIIDTATVSARSVGRPPHGSVASPHAISPETVVNRGSVDEPQACSLCHIPHETESVTQGWTRDTKMLGLAMTEREAMSNHSPAAPDGISTFCLSCHDGTVANNQLIDGSGIFRPVNMSAAMDTTVANGLSGRGISEMGGNLSGDHPVSITYNWTKNNKLRPIVNGRVGALPLYGPNGDQVECTTCHNPHGGVGANLRMSNSRSALCTTCHIK